MSILLYLTKLMKYVRALRPGTPKFDPLVLTRETEKLVCLKDNDRCLRKYTDFYVVGVYQGVATGYVVGCNLRCIFCWSDYSRDYPELYGEYYSPEDVAYTLRKLCRDENVERARISGGEPTLCPDHLVQVLELVDPAPEITTFLLETNGILIGHDENYAKRLAQFRKLIVRVSIKASTETKFEKITGAQGKFLELQFRAIKNLLKHGVETYVAAMTDPRLMTPEERRLLFEKIAEIDPGLAQTLEEERVDPYETTIHRLVLADVDLGF